MLLLCILWVNRGHKICMSASTRPIRFFLRVIKHVIIMLEPKSLREIWGIFWDNFIGNIFKKTVHVLGWICRANVCIAFFYYATFALLLPSTKCAYKFKNVCFLIIYWEINCVLPMAIDTSVLFLAFLIRRVFTASAPIVCCTPQQFRLQKALYFFPAVYCWKISMIPIKYVAFDVALKIPPKQF